MVFALYLLLGSVFRSLPNMALGTWPMMPHSSRSISLSNIFSLFAFTLALTAIFSGRIAFAEDLRPLVSLNIQTDQVRQLCKKVLKTHFG